MTATLRGMACLSAAACYAVGNNGTIMASPSGVASAWNPE